MGTYRKKPVEIQAVRVADALRAASLAWADLPKWLADAYEVGGVLFLPNAIEIVTLEGIMTGQRADWIIQGVQGELYPCKPDIFTATYEPAEPASPAELTEARCPSCDHLTEGHTEDGCWYRFELSPDVTHDPMCPCTKPHGQDGGQAEGGR